MQKACVIPDKNTKHKFNLQYNDDGQPICLRWGGGTLSSTVHGTMWSASTEHSNGGPSIAASQAMQGKSESSKSRPLTKERFINHAIGTCPEVNIHIGGEPVHCLLDTGIYVSRLTRSFQCAENNPCEVRFQCISAKQEEVTGDQEFRPKSDSDTRELLSRLQIGGMS